MASADTRWKKGVSANPGGRPRIRDELKAVSQFTTEEMKRLISKYFRMSLDEVLELLEHKELACIDHLIMSTLIVAIKTGDVSRAESLFLRTLGRVTEKMEIDRPEPLIIQRANGEQLVLGAKREEDE